MHNASDHEMTADEIVARVRALQDERDELRRRLAESEDRRHEAWCSVAAHELDLAEYGRCGCYSRPLGSSGDGMADEVGGWITQRGPGTEPRIVLDTRPLGIGHEPLTLKEAADLVSFLGRALAEVAR